MGLQAVVHGVSNWTFLPVHQPCTVINDLRGHLAGGGLLPFAMWVGLGFHFLGSVPRIV